MGFRSGASRYWWIKVEHLLKEHFDLQVRLAPLARAIEGANAVVMMGGTWGG